MDSKYYLPFVPLEEANLVESTKYNKRLLNMELYTHHCLKEFWFKTEPKTTQKGQGAVLCMFSCKL